MDVAREGGASTTVKVGDKYRVSTTYRDGTQLVEEYDIKTNNLLTRRWRLKSKLGGIGGWQYEIGEPVEERKAGEGVLIKESSSHPVVVPMMTANQFVWRIRNLPYPKEVYQISVDEEKQEIVVRTTNKKYFKRLTVPALRRAGIPLDPTAVDSEYSGTTLVITYDKPEEFQKLEAEQAAARWKELSSSKESDVGCKQQ